MPQLSGQHELFKGLRIQQKMPQAPNPVPSHAQRDSEASQWALRPAFLCFLPSSLGPQPRGKFLPQDSVFHVAGADSMRTSADCPPTPFHPLLTPRAPDPTLFFFPKGQRLARLRLVAARSSGLPSGVPRLLSEGTRLITWLKSSNSKSPGRANPDLCNSMRTWESFGKGHRVNGNQRLV